MNKTISCPKCNYEYLLGEIFTPINFLGQPKNIIRDIKGEILGYEGIESDMHETFICENCNTSFDIDVNISLSINTLDNEIKIGPKNLF